MKKVTTYTILLFGLFFYGNSLIYAQSVPNTCDCQLDTLGLFDYLSDLTLNEQEPLEISVQNANSTFAVLHGTIGSSTPSKVENLINNYPNVTTLVFTTVPGSGDDAANLMAAKAINAKGYTTYLPAVEAYAETLEFENFIASGGVDLFLAGKTRIIDEGAELGVHAWADGEGKEATDFEDDDEVHQSYIDYYIQIGFSEAAARAFYFFTINAAPAADIHPMTEEEIATFNLRTCTRPNNCDGNDGDGNGDGGNDGDGNGDGGNDGGGNDGDGNGAGNNEVEWTYLVYLNGSDLEQEEKGNSGTNDLAEMTAAGSTNNVNVIVTTGGTNKPGWKTIRRFKIDNGEQKEISFNAANNDMANTQNLTDFINWAISTYPAKKYVLDLWNHGMDIRGYGHDENTDKEMKVPDVQTAIANSDFIKAGNRFEIIGFDACLMATIEVQNTLQNFGNYFVGSEETEPGHGWDYTPIIQAMENQTDLDGAGLGKIIADNFFAQAKDQGTNNVTLSVTDLAQTNALIGALEDLTNAIKIGGTDLLQKVQKARSQAEEYSKSLQNPAQSEDMVDIGDMMKKLRSTAPELDNQAAAVLSVLNQAVTHNVKDNTRPNATGIAMFWPHNKLVDEDALNQSFTDDYGPIEFSPAIKNFIQEDYAKNVMADQVPPEGDFVDYEEDGTLRAKHSQSNSREKERWSAIKIPNSEDLEQVQVVLSSTTAIDGEAGDVLLLGATLPDVEDPAADGSGTTYAYLWDGFWLGINGFPAYIADIFEYGIEQADGTETYYTRVKILAVLNPDADGNGQDIIISYFREGDEADFQVESIVPETYGENVMLTAKERIQLKAGDRVQLLYEGFNPSTGEDFYAIDEAAIFTIENGNQDLELDYDPLDYGDYTLGFQLLDYAQNDTILFDPNPVFLSTSTVNNFADNGIQMYPNPTNNQVAIALPTMSSQGYQVQLLNLNGQIVTNQIFTTDNFNLDVSSLVTGLYVVKIITGNKLYSDKLLIQR